MLADFWMMDQFQEKQQEKVTYYGKDVQTCISRRCWIHNAGCAGYFTKQILLDQAIELRNHREAMDLTGITKTHF